MLVGRTARAPRVWSTPRATMMKDVLDAKVVASIDDLELSARIIVEGMRQGGNRSPFK